MLCMNGGLMAQIGVTAEVNKNPVGEGDQFKYIITVSGSTRANVTPPSFQNFDLLGGPYTSSNFSMVNGTITSSVTYTYILSPRAKGTFNLNPAKVNAKGKQVESNSLSVKVIEGNSVSSTPGAKGSGKSATSSGGKDVFLRTYVSKRNVFQGEQISVSYILYCSSRKKFDLINYEFPRLNGFWKEDIKIKEIQWESKQQVIDGRSYRKAYLARQILFPQQFGELVIEPFTVEGRVGRSFFHSGLAINEKSNRVKLQVKALPKGAPESFSGAIGKFNFKTETDRNNLKVNESIDLKLTISGSGNLKLINDIPIKFPQDFEVYDPELQDKISVNARGVSGSRQFNYLIIPRYPGQYEIPPLEFSFFDPELGKYITRKSDTMEFSIERSDEEDTEDRLRTIRKEGVSVVEEDIRYIKTQSVLKSRGDTFLGSGAYYGTLFSPALALIFFVLYRKVKQKQEEDPVAMGKRRARKRAQKLMSEAREQLDKGNNEAFYESVSRALNGYLSGKLVIDTMDLSHESIKDTMHEKGLSDHLVDKYIQLIDRCQMARFASVADTDKQSLLQEAEDIIENVEGAL